MMMKVGLVVRVLIIKMLKLTADEDGDDECGDDEVDADEVEADANSDQVGACRAEEQVQPECCFKRHHH